MRGHATACHLRTCAEPDCVIACSCSPHLASADIDRMLTVAPTEITDALLDLRNGERVMTPATVSRVPNKPKTPLHSFRVDDELWEAAKKRAEERGEHLSDALRKFLRRYTR